MSTKIEKPELGINPDDIDKVTASIERLTAAIKAMGDELDRLADKQHGGVTFEMCGSIAVAEIKPAA